MILIVGARGRLGSTVARRLLAEGKPVRAMSRTPRQLDELRALGAEVVAGDLRDSASLAAACQGVDAVLAAAHAFDGKGTNVPTTVDDAGNRALIDAARAAGVRHFVLTSILTTREDHPVDLFRIKAVAERHLRASGLSFTILRPTAFMELWWTVIGAPVLRGKKALIFGRGANPINFVSVENVADLAVTALTDPAAANSVIEIGGPENLTLVEVARLVERAMGRTTGEQHIPLGMMRVMRVLSRPFNPAFSRQVAAGIFMDTHDMTFDPSATLARFPMRLIRMEEVVRRYAGATGAAAGPAVSGERSASR
ncbi:MAG TPA: SDR family oxidoreductase [Ktedonobacterales bacterium]|nr:SDR family oxidoreductase [Ktedonobacterales bacterium]